MKKLLVAIDMQNDFVSGALGSAQARGVVQSVRQLIESEREAGASLAFTLDTHGEDYPDTQEGKLLPVPHCIKGTAGWEVVPELAPYLNGATVFEKPAFGSVALAEYVKANGFDEVMLCGVCTDICVVGNALLIKAFCPEVRVVVKANACAGTTVQNHESAIATMKSCQVIVE